MQVYCFFLVSIGITCTPKIIVQHDVHTVDGSEILRSPVEWLVVENPIIYDGFYTSKRWFSRRIISEPSTVCFIWGGLSFLRLV